MATTGYPPQEVLKAVSLSVSAGEMLGVVGEAGSGKSILAFAIMGLLPPGLRVVSGTIHFDGQDLLCKSEREMRRIRGRDLAMILPGGHFVLNPMETIGTQMKHLIRSHLEVDSQTVHKMTMEILTAVGINDPERRLSSYPHELSGGMAQRIVISQAMVLAPKVLIADEPTSDLDVTVAAQILDEMKGLLERKDAATLLLTRDLGIVAQYCDRVAVLHQGEIIEYASVTSFFTRAYHPSSVALLAAAARARSDESTGSESLSPAPPLGMAESGEAMDRNHKGSCFGESDDTFHSGDYVRISEQHIVRRF